MTRIRITPVHTHQIPVRHSYHGEWLQQLATETHCMLDWVDDTVSDIDGLEIGELRRVFQRVFTECDGARI